MARTGGRSTWFSWFIGIVMVGIVAALVWFAAPAFPAVAIWVGDQYRNATGANDPLADPATPTPTAEPTASGGPVALPAECAQLYPETLWELLSSTAGAALTQDGALPEAASELAPVLGAAKPLVCGWTIPTGPSITTVVAAVDEHAPDAAATYLGAHQFACTTTGVETSCVRDADGTIETHEVRGGIWTMSVQDGWRPPGYSDAVSARLWG